MKLRLHAVLAALALGSFADPALAATTWYVDRTGVAPGTGTLADPYTSIQYAIDRPTTVLGDTLLVAPGVYAEDVAFHDKAIFVRSSAGPALTRITPGLAVVDVGENFGTLEGFTIDGRVKLFSASLRRCVVLATPQEHDHGVLSADISSVAHCAVSGFDVGVKEYPLSSGDVVVENTILWNCTLGASSPSGTGGTLRYCAGVTTALGGWTVSNSVPGDPGLWDLAGGDAHPKPGSPCIDAGNPASPLDPDGSRADIGVLSYDPSYTPGPTVYCVGKPNSQGCVPAISASGQASATSALPFTISADLVVDQKTGRLLYGFTAAATPFQGGTLCIGSFRRTEAQNSGGGGPCSGHYAYDMNARIQSGIDPDLVPGKLVYAQYWQRDPLDPSGFTIGLSDAVRFGIAP